jgi:hypothetical protein
MSTQSLRAEGGRDPGHVLKAVPATGTTPVTLIFEMAKADNFSLQLIWNVALTAHVTVGMSNSYNPNPEFPQDETKALNPGNWLDTGSRYLADFTDPAATASGGEIHGTFVECAWLKMTITPSSMTRTIAHHSSDAVVAATSTWTLGNGAFTASDVGASIVVTGDATADGTYVIESVTNSTTIVTATGPAADSTLGSGTSVALARAGVVDGYLSGKSL